MSAIVDKKTLTLEELAILEIELSNKAKKNDIAWALWASLSFFGAHRFYTENYSYASAMFLTSFFPLIAIIILLYLGLTDGSLFVVALSLLAASVIWSWIDAYFLNKIIEDLNHDIEIDILKKIKGTN